MRIFGRDTFSAHGVLGQVALDCIRHPEESIQVIGWNLLSDHRVTEARAEHFYQATGKPADVDQLKRALQDYHRDWVCRRPEDTYLSRNLNRGNFIPMSRLRDKPTLVTVLNVSAWVNWLRTQPGPGTMLESKMARATQPGAKADDVEGFLDQLFAAINMLRDQRPIWVARWTEFKESFDPARPSSWNRAVGVWRQQGSWQAIVCYPLANVPRLVRPTQLDSGFYQYHFPSPPFSRPTRGGFTMALREFSKLPALVPEWLHPPIDLKLDYWIEAGRLLDQVEDDFSASIWLYRSQHRQRLNRRFEKYVGGWLPPR